MSKAKAKTPLTEADVERRLEKNRKGWEEASWAKENPKQKKLPPDNTVHSKLKRVVYKLIRDCIKYDLISFVEGYVNSDFDFDGSKKLKSSQKNKTNPFYWGLLAVCGPENQLPRSTRSRFALELQYAHMHDVPPEFLVGFLYQKGPSKDLQEKIDNKEMQKWYKKKTYVTI